MTADDYRTHKSGALRRAFFRGGDAGAAGALLSDNLYRRTRDARRGTWSEALATAWAVGWKDHHAKRVAEVGAASPAITRTAS